MDDKNIIKKKDIFPKSVFFFALSKGQKSTSNFEKHLKQQRCSIRRLNVPNFGYFLKEIKMNMVKIIKNCSKSLIRYLTYVEISYF